jgi:hypothetical protein
MLYPLSYGGSGRTNGDTNQPSARPSASGASTGASSLWPTTPKFAYATDQARYREERARHLSASAQGVLMGDKSPKKKSDKKQGKSLKEKRAEKHQKNQSKKSAGGFGAG